MKESFLPQLNIYDHLGYLLVGFVTIWILQADLKLTMGAPPILPNVWELIVAAYLAGHLVQAIASSLVDAIGPVKLWLEKGKRSTSDGQREILGKAREHFGLSKIDDRELWRLCYLNSCSADPSGHVKLFNAYFSFFRGIAFAGVLQALVALAFIFLTPNRSMWLLVFWGAVVTVWCFSARAQRFHAYLSEKALHAFMISLINSPTR